MVRVRFLQAVGGDEFSYAPGEEVDLPGAQAEMWADGVRAELVRGESAETPEKSVARRSGQVETTAAPPAASAPARPEGTTSPPAPMKKNTRRG